MAHRSGKLAKISNLRDITAMQAALQVVRPHLKAATQQYLDHELASGPRYPSLTVRAAMGW